MILNATVSVVDAAEVLGASEADVRAELHRGSLAGSHIGGSPRIGWRSLAAALECRFAAQPETLAGALLRLSTIRAGVSDYVASYEEPLDGGASTVESASGCSPDGAYRLALLAEAARAAGGGDKLSGARFDAWTLRQGLVLTAAALIGEYGSWNAAKRAAGVACRDARRRRAATNTELVQHLRAAAAQPRRSRLTMAQFDSYCAENGADADAGLVASRFGSWNRGKALAGVAQRPRGYQREIGLADPSGDPNRPSEG
jgi:hypothetical protein